MKAREKRRRRQLRKARQWQPSLLELDRAIAGAKLILRETHKDLYTTEGAWDWLYRQLKAWEKARAERGPMQGTVGHTGDIVELLEYPCNCEYCRGETERQKRKEREAGRSL